MSAQLCWRTLIMNVDDFLEELRSDPNYAGQIVYVHESPARDAKYAPRASLSGSMQTLTERVGIERLYSHQAEALCQAQQGADVLVATGTASGKTFCYALPILERLLADPTTTALLLFPTKALCQDQFRAMHQLLDRADLTDLLTGVFDGDTPPTLRRKLRDHGSVIFSNPDMLHASLMPQHARWADFLSRLQFLVLDELHVYSGIFGSNMTHLLNRFLRVCRHYGSSPQVIACSATIANPTELAERLLGRAFALVDEDGSPRGRRVYVFWNPPRVRQHDWRSRRSANVEAHELMAKLIAKGTPTITFSKAKMTAEMIHRYVCDNLRRTAPAKVARVTPYRGGYLPQERREIEQRLFSGELLGVSTTAALELGIDVGSLEASIIVGYPGTLASFFQQAGRAGRKDRDSVIFLVGLDTTVNQYIMSHPDYLFERCIEHAVIDPDNPFVVTGHLRCATHEMPVSDAELPTFGPHAEMVLNVLNDNLKVKRIDERWYSSSSEVPQHEVPMRSYADENVVIEEVKTREVIGQVNKFDAEPIVHPGAIYMHRGDTYRIIELDLDRNVATAERVDVDYYTQPLGGTDIHHVDQQLREKELGTGKVYWGEVTAYFKNDAYEKIHFYSLDAMSVHDLDLPTMVLETLAFWIVPPEALMEAVRSAGLDPHSGLRGIGYATRMLLPLFMTCDTLDFSHTIGSVNSPWNAIFVYERYPHGLGFTDKAYDLLDRIVPHVRENVVRCPCQEGCPCCVGKPLRRYTTWNVERGEASIPSKPSTLMILDGLLGDMTNLKNLDTDTLVDSGDERAARLEQALRRRLERAREPQVFHPIKPAPEVKTEYPEIEGKEQLGTPDVERRAQRRRQFDRDLHKRIAKRIGLDGLHPLTAPAAERPAGTRTRGANLRPSAFPGRPDAERGTGIPPGEAPTRAQTPGTGASTGPREQDATPTPQHKDGATPRAEPSKATDRPVAMGDALAARARKRVKRKTDQQVKPDDKG